MSVFGLNRYLSNNSDEETEDVEAFQRPYHKYHRYSLDLPGLPF
jgi:hypothetical protein